MRFPERQGASARFLRSPDSRILFRSSGLLVLAIFLRLLLGKLRHLSERMLRTHDCGRKGQESGRNTSRGSCGYNGELGTLCGPSQLNEAGLVEMPLCLQAARGWRHTGGEALLYIAEISKAMTTGDHCQKQHQQLEESMSWVQNSSSTSLILFSSGKWHGKELSPTGQKGFHYPPHFSQSKSHTTHESKTKRGKDCSREVPSNFIQ